MALSVYCTSWPSAPPASDTSATSHTAAAIARDVIAQPRPSARAAPSRASRASARGAAHYALVSFFEGTHAGSSGSSGRCFHRAALKPSSTGAARSGDAGVPNLPVVSAPRRDIFRLNAHTIETRAEIFSGYIERTGARRSPVRLIGGARSRSVEAHVGRRRPPPRSPRGHNAGGTDRIRATGERDGVAPSHAQSRLRRRNRRKARSRRTEGAAGTATTRRMMMAPRDGATEGFAGAKASGPLATEGSGPRRAGSGRGASRAPARRGWTAALIALAALAAGTVRPRVGSARG